MLVPGAVECTVICVLYCVRARAHTLLCTVLHKLSKVQYIEVYLGHSQTRQ